jgi:hypothetical protein
MKLEIRDTNGDGWLSDDTTVGVEELAQLSTTFQERLGTLVIAGMFNGQRRWFHPSQIVWVQMNLDDEEQTVLNAYWDAILDADRRRKEAEAAAEAARAEAARARGETPPPPREDVHAP